MKTVIIYATKHGASKKAAEKLAAALTGPTQIINILNESVPDLEKTDNVILGGSVYIGKLNKQLAEYLTKNLAVLLSKKCGLFICGARTGEEADKELETVFPPELYNSAAVKLPLGYELDFNKMGFLEKIIVKKVMSVNDSVFMLSDDAIARFAAVFNQN